MQGDSGLYVTETLEKEDVCHSVVTLRGSAIMKSIEKGLFSFGLELTSPRV